MKPPTFKAAADLLKKPASSATQPAGSADTFVSLQDESRRTAEDRHRFAPGLKGPGGRVALIDLALRLLVGGAFVFAGALKVANPAKFATDIGNYRLAPHELINLIAILLPWVEVTTGVFVLAGIWTRAAAAIITSLTVSFFFIIVSALARGLNIECGCFGTVGGKHIGLVSLAIDTALFGLAAVLLKRAGEPHEFYHPPETQNSARPFESWPKISSTKDRAARPAASGGNQT